MGNEKSPLKAWSCAKHYETKGNKGMLEDWSFWMAVLLSIVFAYEIIKNLWNNDG